MSHQSDYKWIFWLHVNIDIDVYLAHCKNQLLTLFNECFIEDVPNPAPGDRMSCNIHFQL